MLYPEIIEKIKNSIVCKARLMVANNCSERTILNWCDHNDKRLCTLRNISIISIVFLTPIDEMVETEVEEFSYLG